MKKKRELLFTVTAKDCELETFRAGGKGGQHQNKKDTGVRIIHKDSGAVGESRSERSQYQNKKLAFQRLVEDKKFKVWVNRMAYELSKGKSLMEMVDDSTEPKYLKIEIKDPKGRWRVVDEEWKYEKK